MNPQHTFFFPRPRPLPLPRAEVFVSKSIEKSGKLFYQQVTDAQEHEHARKMKNLHSQHSKEFSQLKVGSQ